MKASYKDLLRHSAIYGVGQILSRLASVILLPVYTRFLSPSDYGVIAILDLAAGIGGIMVGVGLANAVQRYHFRTPEGPERDSLWWTGLMSVGGLAVLVVTPVILLREPLSVALLGPGVEQGSRFVTLAAFTFCFSVLEQILQTHLRAEKRSTLLVVTNLSRLALNLTLNLILLVGLHWGVAAILWGNLWSGFAAVIWLLSVFYRRRPAFQVDRKWLLPLAKFGGPLVATGLLALGMHRGDRYLLRIFLDLDQVGLYSVAYSIGQAVNTLVLMPFTQIWRVVIFELESDTDAKRIYVTVFRYFFDFLGLFLFSVSLFAKPLIRLLVDPRFLPAADLVPIICLAYLFFSLNVHFNVPALLANKTTRLIGPSFLALLVNLLLNVFLIPRVGVAGAAWASVLTFATLSFSGLWVYRRVDKYPYAFRHSFMVASGLVLTFLAAQRWLDWDRDPERALVGRLILILAWALLLFRDLGASDLYSTLKERVSRRGKVNSV